MKLGIYQHYRNKKNYEVLWVANHSETLEKLVVYKTLYDSEDFGKNSIWVRPYDMFVEDVEREGVTVPRFSYVGQ